VHAVERDRGCTEKKVAVWEPSTRFAHGGTGGSRRAGFEMAKSDAALGQVVRRQLQRHVITRQNANVVLAHFSGGVGHHLMAVFQNHSESGIGQDLFDLALHLDQFFLGQWGSFQAEVGTGAPRRDPRKAMDRPQTAGHRNVRNTGRGKGLAAQGS